MGAKESHFPGHSTACSKVYQVNKKEAYHQSLALLILCVGNPPVTGGFPTQRVSNAKWVDVMTSLQCNIFQSLVQIMACRLIGSDNGLSPDRFR